MTFEPLTFGSLLRKLEDKLILFDAKMLEPLTFVSLFGKKSLVQLFFGACCVCLGEKVVLFGLKIFLCRIKRQKQRCFRSLTKR